jgi:hypothetical protein
VFTQTATSWKRTAELKGSSDTNRRRRVRPLGVHLGHHGRCRCAVPCQLAGWVYVFMDMASGWRQTAELKGSDSVAGDYFCRSLAISGTTVVVGF